MRSAILKWDFQTLAALSAKRMQFKDASRYTLPHYLLSPVSKPMRIYNVHGAHKINVTF